MSARALAPVALGLTVVAVACSRPAVEPAPPDPVRELQTLIDSIVASDEAIPGVALAVICPRLGIDWEGAAGLADPEAGAPMTAANPVRIASNTKTYTAAAALRLVEDGRLDLDSPIADHLSTELADLLIADGYDPTTITVRHLLTHTGGLDDHGAEEYTAAIMADPQRHWTPADQIAGLVEWGDKLAEPGTVYSYSDSGYVLLGQVIEQITGRNLAEAVRQLVGIDGLGLDSTWWEILEPAPEGVADRAHQFLGDLDVWAFVPTFDLYGGGGIAATAGDLARFFDAVVRGRVFRDPDTIDIMLSTLDDLAPAPGASERALPPGAYRMGVWTTEIGGRAAYRHTGFWGTSAVHVPELDLTFASTVNQNQCGDAPERLDRGVVAIVGELGP
jgi:D-alanyl-D-alanine carboxypeptidase